MTMRRVEFKEWIPIQWDELSAQNTSKSLPNTNCWSDWTGTGLFHQWANAYEEFESGPGNYTVALIEIVQPGGGIMIEVLPSNLRFKDAP